VIVSDGTIVSDGVIVSDGTIVSDGVIVSDAFVQAQSAAVNGDLTIGSTAVVDSGVDCLNY
jgi:tetrahydrodipicolinate N-succinyltransferase